MMKGIADSVTIYHIKFECSGTGGGCADHDAKNRSVRGKKFHDFI